MAAQTSQTSPSMQLTMSPTLPHLVLSLDPQLEQKLPALSDSSLSALCPSIQLNLPKPQVSLLFHNPTLPSLGMQTTVKWRHKQQLVA